MHKYLYTMFDKKFHSIIEEDILDLDKKTGPHKLVAIRGLNRDKQTQIPDSHKSPAHSTEKKIEMLKNKGTGIQVCTPQDIQYLTTKYHIHNLTPAKPRGLGKTGITIMYDNNYKQYILKK
jgi:hypothetical protein